MKLQLPTSSGDGAASAASRRWSMSSASIHVTRSGSMWRRALAFVGPGYLVSVGYMDPGNWATSIAGGAQFGYALLAVALMSNIMAIILQSLCARLAIGSGRDLAQACRDAFPRPVALMLWLFAEIAIIATDIAEVVGTAIGLNLLFGIPLELGVIITALDVFLILWLQRLGFRWIEAFIIALLGVIFVCFFFQIALADPDWRGVILGFAPTVEIVKNPAMLYLALGIIGATVMPHNLYLHSGIVQTRDYGDSLPEKREALRFATWDSTVALMFALLVNASILILAAATFHQTGADDGGRNRRCPCHAGAAGGLAAGAEAVCHRAAVLRPQFDGDGHHGRADRHGRISRHQAAGLAAAADHPHDRHRAGGGRDHLLRRRRHRHAADPQPGDPRLPAALRHRAAGDVHARQGQDGRAGGARVADGGGGRHRRHHHRAEHEAAVGYLAVR